jgi:uncharacterized membrane protein
MFQNLIDILASPMAVFTRLKEKPSFLFPWLLITLAVASIQTGFFLLVDHDYLVDQLVEQAMASNPTAGENQLRQNLSAVNPSVFAASSAVAGFLVLTVIMALNAVYLNFMAKFSHGQYSFKSWFSMMAWTGIPGLFVALAAWVSILTASNGLISLASLQPLSLDSLLGLDSGNRMLQSINLPQFWSMGLMVVGYKQWTGASTLKSAVITLAPYALIYGVWAAASLA